MAHMKRDCLGSLLGENKTIYEWIPLYKKQDQKGGVGGREIKYLTEVRVQVPGKARVRPSCFGVPLSDPSQDNGSFLCSTQSHICVGTFALKLLVCS